jgi:serine protease Do
VFTFAFRPKNPSVAAAAPTPAAPGIESAPQPTATPENTIADLNKDGKIDVQDILLALQEHQKKQKKDEEQ